MKSTLSTFKKGSASLDHAYGEALQRVESQPGDDPKLAKKVLSWITYAKRPLTTTEICCALAVDPGDADLDRENVPDIDDLVTVCAGLVVVDPESGIIRLVHYTTQDYLERIGTEWNPDAQLNIARTCLTYLSFDTFKSGGCSSAEDFEERLRQNEFLNYAAKHWGEHTVTVQDDLNIREMASSFLTDNKLVFCATQVIEMEDMKPFFYESLPGIGQRQIQAKGSTGLHLVARCGWCSLLEVSLEALKNEEILAAFDFRDSRDHTPLTLAATCGHDEMVNLLLEKGANVNMKGGVYGSALQAASFIGHGQVVKLLLDHGADVNIQGGHYGSALQAASFIGHEQVVKLLLDHGANVNMKGGYYNSALQAASFIGHGQVVKLLLDYGADVNTIQGGLFYGSALQAASANGHEQVVKLLLDYGANVNMKGGVYDSALEAASTGGHKQVVKLLLDHGANVNMKGGYYNSALQAASAEGHEQIVKLLLQKGAIASEEYSGTL